MAVSTQDPAEAPTPEEPRPPTHPPEPLTTAEVTGAAEAVKAARATPGRPPFIFEELAGAANVVKEDPRWLDAMAKRGITGKEQIDLVQVDPWPAGNFAFAGEEGKRLCRCVSYVRTFDKDNGY